MVDWPGHRYSELTLGSAARIRSDDPPEAVETVRALCARLIQLLPPEGEPLRTLPQPEFEIPEGVDPEEFEPPEPEIDWDAYLNSYQFNEPSTASNKGNVATDDMPSFEANLVNGASQYPYGYSNIVPIRFR